MSKISKYLQITDKLLLEYSYDTEAKLTSSNVRNMSSYIVRDNANHLQIFEIPTSQNISMSYVNSFMYNAFMNKTEDTFFYPGYLSYSLQHSNYITKDVVRKPTDDNTNNHYFYEDNNISNIVQDRINFQVPFDTIRIHILSGYTFNDTLGFLLSVKGSQTGNAEYKSADNNVILQNFIFHKGNISNVIKFNSHPFYMSQRFYDRYIEFQVPSLYYMGVNKSDNDFFKKLSINPTADIMFEYASIDDTTFNSNNKTVEYIDNDTDLHLYNQGTFTKVDNVTASITLISNSNYFNAKIYEDTESNCIRYYPIWGRNTSDNPVTISIMNSIENGSIPLNTPGFLYNDQGDIESFTEIYGEDARQWIVVNELEMRYVYSPMIASGSDNDNIISRTEKFSRTETFEDPNSDAMSVDDLYKFYYKPVVAPISGYYCDYIDITYTARLVNRLNGTEIVRLATIVINDAEEKFGIDSKKINVSNIYTWRLYNKIETSQPIINANGGKDLSKTKYITKYFTNNDIVVGEDGTAYKQGMYNIALYDTDNIYKFRLYTDDSLSTAYPLSSTNATYLLRCSDKDGAIFYLNPTYSLNMSETIGELEYKISAINAKKILAGDKKFAVIAKTDNGISTIFAGTFTSIYD